MKKHDLKKNILSILLAVCMLISEVPLPRAYAASDDGGVISGSIDELITSAPANDGVTAPPADGDDGEGNTDADVLDEDADKKADEDPDAGDDASEGAPSEDEPAVTEAPKSAAPEAQAEDAPAPAKPTVKELNFSADIVLPTSELLSGGTFDLNLGYSLPGLEGGEEYKQLQFYIDLRPYVGLIEYVSASGQSLLKEPYYNQYTYQLSVYLKNNISTGTGEQISIKFKANNLAFPNGETPITLPISIKGQISSSGSEPVSIVGSRSASTTVHAYDGWRVKKSRNGSVSTLTGDDGKEYYVVPYLVAVQDTNGGTKDANGDRNGRVETTKISIVDTLPNKNIPAGGEAAKVTDVQILGSSTPVDYTYADGTITFSTMNTAEGTNFVPAGTPMTTQYTYNVWYPKEAYLTDSNQELATEYDLENTVDLAYTMKGQDEIKLNDKAVVTLGDKRVSTDKADLKVKKRVSVGGKAFDYDPAYGKASFTLYEVYNAETGECSNIVRSFDGRVPAGAMQRLPANGVVTFKDLLPGKTYYLQETIEPGSNMTAAKYVTAVTLPLDAKPVVSGNSDASVKDGVVIINNNVENVGNLEFFKYGLGADGETNPMPDVTFTLTSKDDPEKVYPAVSDSKGHVLFAGIPAGSYILQEAKLADDYRDEYTLFDKPFEIDISANGLVYPAGFPNPDCIVVDGEDAPVFVNISTKGLFQIRKISAQDEKIFLTGAVFDVYAKNSDGSRGECVQHGLTTGAADVAVSEPLPEGTYILVETKSPEGYSVIGSGETEVKVIAREMNDEPFIIRNNKNTSIIFHKIGVISAAEGKFETMEELEGVEFALYDSDSADAKPIATVKTKNDGTGKAIARIDNLAPGDYWYEEISMPASIRDSYTLDTARHKITLNVGEDLSLDIDNHAKYALLRLVKKAQVSGKELEGAEFGVYTDPACKTPLKVSGKNLTFTTGSDGVGEVRIPISSGTGLDCYIKELKAPTGFSLDQTPIRAPVSTDSILELGDIINSELRSIRIKKVDSKNSDTLIPGVSFSLYGPYDAPQTNLSGTPRTATTGDNGIVEFTGLEPGKYYYARETKTNANYIMPAETVTEIQTDSRNELVSVKVIKNDRKGNIVIKKMHNLDVAADTKPEQYPVLPGVKFDLYKAEYKDGSYVKTGLVLKSGTTDQNGTLSFTDLTPGAYIISEAVTPAGYEPADDKTVIVGPGDNVPGYDVKVTGITNIANKGKVEVDKVSSKNSNTHLEATFAIFKADPNDARKPTGTAVATLKTPNTDKHAVSGWLEPGNYVLIETGVTDSAHYTLDPDPHPFVITAGHITKFTGNEAIKNVPKGELMVRKYSKFQVNGTSVSQTYPLSGASFSFYKKTGDDYNADIVGKTPAFTLDMSSSTFMSTNLRDAGYYWVVETKFPKDYFAEDKTRPVTINGKEAFVVADCQIKPEEQNTININNITEKSRIRINKVDFVNPQNLLNGAEFEVYVVDEQNGTPTNINGETVKLTRAKVTASSNNQGFILQSGTHGKGSALTIDIKDGTYYIKETSVENIPGGPWHPANGVWRGPVTVGKGEERVVRFENFRTNVVGEKKDGATLENLPNAVIAAFATEADAIKFINYVKGQHVTLVSANRTALINNLKSAKFLADNKIVDVCTTDSDGEFMFTKLQPDSRYYIAEAVPPVGYSLEGKAHAATVNSTGTGFTSSIVIMDYKLGRLSVEKLTKLGDNLLPINGVHYTVYEADAMPNDGEASKYPYIDNEGTHHYAAGFKVAEGTTVDDGKFTSIILEQGVYIVVEDSIKDAPAVGWPDGYDKDGYLDGVHPYRIIVVTDENISNQLKEDESLFDRETSFENPAVYGKFLFKKVTQDGIQLDGSTFKLFKADDYRKNGTKATAIAQYSPKGIVVSDFLPIGEYVLVETTTPNNYTTAHPVYFTIESGGYTGSLFGEYTQPSDEVSMRKTNTEPVIVPDESKPILIKNERQGSIELLKVGSFDGKIIDSALQSIVFGLYRDEACQNKVSERVTGSNGNGKARWDNLDAGTYYLKELRDQRNYYKVDSTVKAIKVEIGKTTSLTGDKKISNDTTYGNFKIKKVDANDNDLPLKDVVFEVYTDKACTKRAKGITISGVSPIYGQDASITTGADGVGVSPLLPAGDYYLKEVKAATGYQKATDIFGPYKVESNTQKDYTGEVITNIKFFKIVLTKVGTDTSGKEVKLQGAQFALYDADPVADSAAKPIKTITSNSNGLVSFIDLPYPPEAKTYYIKETQPPVNHTPDSTVYPVAVEYGNKPLADADTFTVKLGKADQGKVYNPRFGTVSIVKFGRWMEVGDLTTVEHELPGVIFNMYAVSGPGVSHAANARIACSFVTDAEGKATSAQLPAGWYELAEARTPDGFLPAGPWWVEIIDDRDDVQLVQMKAGAEGEQAEETVVVGNTIVNIANQKGRFMLFKHDGVEGNTSVLLSDAVFRLVRRNGSLSDDPTTWKPFNPSDPNITTVNGSYYSAMLPTDEYAIIEVTAPTYKYVDKGKEHIIRFTMSDKPIKFNVTVGVTTPVHAYNIPKGSIVLTKYGINEKAGKHLLSGAEFALYTDAECTSMIPGSKKTTSVGVITWEDVEPGTYWVKELPSQSISDQGYGISSMIKQVIVPDRMSVEQVIAGDAIAATSFDDMANQGKLRIVKQAADGSALSGAEFKIYAKDEHGEFTVTKDAWTVRTGGDGSGISVFLPAEDKGTEYKVVETKAPIGYTLDGSLSVLEKLVTVYPMHEPENVKAGAVGKNCVLFVNRRIDSISQLSPEIHKTQRKDSSSAFSEAVLNAPRSLLTAAYTLDYKLDVSTCDIPGCNHKSCVGSNETPIVDFILTDDGFEAFSLRAINDGASAEDEITMNRGDYRINSVTVLPSSNGDANEKVTAELWIKTPSSPVYSKFGSVLTLDAAQNVTFPKGTDPIGIQIRYSNTLARFKCGGAEMNVTFKERTFSTDADNEVRLVRNTGSLTWKGTYINEKGETVADHDSHTKSSNPVQVNFPPLSNQLPIIDITTSITDSTKVFYSGDTIHFEVTGSNESEISSGNALEQPVLSFKLPAQTELIGNTDDRGFLVKKVSADGRVFVVDPESYTISSTDVNAATEITGDGEFGELETFKTKQYTFTFHNGSGSDFKLQPGEKIVIQFAGNISYEQKGSFSLVIPGYMSSAHLIPPTATNPNGMSFIPKSKTEVENNTADSSIDSENVDFSNGDKLQYINAYDERAVQSSTAVKLLKEVSSDDITYSATSPAYVNSGGTVYYRLTVYNFSKENLSRAKLVDIFPCANDKYVISPDTNRGTDVPFGEGYEPITLKAIEYFSETSDKVDYFYTDRDWSTGRNGAAESAEHGILHPLYFSVSDWDGWKSGMDGATAVGMEIEFGSGGLAPGKSVSFKLTMRAPGYTADHIAEYYGKLMNNSAALAVVASDPNPPQKIPLNNIVEPNYVSTGMTLPIGTIGDYVWLDTNLNGIQDAGEKGVEGVPVNLYQIRYYLIEGSKDVHRTVNRIASTVTNQDGKYLFENLNCQFLENTDKPDSTDPADYVGKEYYEYQVEFVNSTGYAFTKKDQGSDDAKDSDVTAGGRTDPIRLRIKQNADGSIVGEVNKTLDAGLIYSYSLGDYVWLDLNQNGVQDEGEPGVQGVPVYLYQQDETGKMSEEYIRTETDAYGNYRFNDLAAGVYQVEFDLTNLKKSDGYTYRYDFAPVKGGSKESDTDSDASIEVPGTDGRRRRTKLIKLNDQALTAAGLYNKYDPRWDAGLVVYSAIGGFVFDDMDYDDLHQINVPLPGTTVELYELGANGSPVGKAIATQTVGQDGKYFFDHLAFSNESKDYTVKFTFPLGYKPVRENIGDVDNGHGDPELDSPTDSDVNKLGSYKPGVDRAYGYIEKITLKQDTVTTTWDAGARLYGAIGDYVWADSNKDGIQDPTEPGVALMPVILQSRPDASSDWQLVASKLTDTNGKYLFEELPCSSRYYSVQYRVVFAFEPDTVVTKMNSGTDFSVDSDANSVYRPDIIPVIPSVTTNNGGFVTSVIDLAYGETDLTWDAGIIRELGAIGNYVWYDNDHDGIQDENDLPVVGMTVMLQRNSSRNGRDESQWMTVAKTLTDVEGKYLFDNLEAGYYRVVFVLPKEYVNTRYGRGTGISGNEIDSNASRKDRLHPNMYYSATFYLAQGQHDMSWDAGIYKPRSVRTGDAAQLPMLSAACGLSLLGLLIALRKLRRKA